ncbi:polysaccharide biosynthesis protein GumN [Neorhizobium lilium]|uniref:Polysaccharide biosynthesis protein GumN n=2 Tax=Neorhizobium lilium TaxID=2503024 RepID=A0A3S3TUK9_9HYPH|nr:polysaccharide biosynthesis protein GumN [Neorhizobium lilium]
MILKRAQDLTLWLLAGLHVLALLSFLIVLGILAPALAEDGACGGHNLLEDMKAQNPATYAEVIAEADRIPNGKSIFWKIEKPGLSPSYLLGTMHVTDPRVLRMPPGAAEASAAARTIVVESDEILDEKKAMAGIFANPDLTMFTDGRSLETLLSKDDLALLTADLKQRGIPLSAVSRMKPWMLASAISLPACETARKAENASFLDKQIALDAAAKGKPVKGLETFAEQLSTLAAIPMDLHLKSLIETIKLGSRMDDVFETMTELYLSGNIGLTIPVLKRATPEGGDEAGYAQFEELVVRQRNHHMADRAAPILAEGGVFIAVGALHLPDREGLVELIRRQGYTVTAVN